MSILPRGMTQTGDRDDDRPWVSVHGGYLLLIAEGRGCGVVFVAAVSMKGGGDPYAARLLAKWIDVFG